MAKQSAYCMAWPLVKYGRWNNGRWNDNDYRLTGENPMTLRIQIGELVITQGNTVLDVLNLTSGPTQIKGISKGDALCIYVKYGECYRKFRVKFSPTNGEENGFRNCINVVNILKQFFYIKCREDESDKFLDEPGEFVDIRPITWTSENMYNDIPEDESCLIFSSKSDLEESTIATLLDPSLREICVQINETLMSW